MVGLVWFVLFFISLFIVIPFCLWIFRKGDIIYRLSEWLADWFPLFVNRVGLWFLLTTLILIPALLLSYVSSLYTINFLTETNLTRFSIDNTQIDVVVQQWTTLQAIFLFVLGWHYISSITSSTQLKNIIPNSLFIYGIMSLFGMLVISLGAIIVVLTNTRLDSINNNNFAIVIIIMVLVWLIFLSMMKSQISLSDIQPSNTNGVTS